MNSEIATHFNDLKPTLHSVCSKVEKFVPVVTTGSVAFFSIFDLFIHACPEHRFMLGDFIGKHVGNVAYSAAPTILSIFAGEAIRSVAEKSSRLPSAL